MKTFSFFTEDDLPMVTEIEAEKLARKACEDYMTACNLQDLEQAKLASQKLMAMANELFETMHDGKMTINTIQ